MQNKKFDENYILLEKMYQEKYYPTEIVDLIRAQIIPVIKTLEKGERDLEIIQEKLDEMTFDINEIQKELWELGKEIETYGRQSIASTVEYILNWFDIRIKLETAFREREW